MRIKKEKVSDKEIEKWSRILGANKLIYLYIDDRIALTSKQLDKLIEIKNLEEGDKK